MPSWPCGSGEKVENVKRFTDRQADGQTDKQKGRQTDSGQKVIKKAQGELKRMASISWMSIQYRIQIHSVKCGNQKFPDSYTALQPNIHCVVIIKSLPYDWSKSYHTVHRASHWRCITMIHQNLPYQNFDLNWDWLNFVDT